MLLCSIGNPQASLSAEEMKKALFAAFEKLGGRKKVLVLGPDITRMYSRAGELTYMAYQFYGEKLTDILPALGTHVPMTVDEIKKMYGQTPVNLFRKHNWRTDIVTLGNVPSDFVKKVTGGKLDFDWPAQVNKLLVEGGFDLILSIGQVVPHEVAGMANYNKNIFVGTGGQEGINRSHFIGAVCNMENIMGRADNPVRKVLNYASDNFAKHLPIVYVQTVIGPDAENNMKTRGLFVGDDIECFNKACELCLKVNFNMLDKPIKKAVVNLDPHEYKSTWLGNKSIYRTRMAMADNGHLIVLAPGVKEFGEDQQIDSLIRKYGYVGTDKVLAAVKNNDDLKANLSAAAHLIHGSSEGRFKITYCPGKLTKQEIESVNFDYGDLDEMMKLYNPANFRNGFNTMPDGEEIFFIPNPGLGLWAYKNRFNQ